MTRAIQLIAAAAVGAVAVFCFAPKPAPVRPPLSATDIGFAQDMSAHHQQAITMSDMVATDAAPEVRALADQIRFTQLREIGQMAGWLQLAGAPVVSPHPMAWMMVDPSDHMAGGDTAMAMPGMASPAELERLQRVKGRDNEVLFLQLMTRHHQGGVDMAAYVVQHSSTAVVHQTAVAMVDEQSQELIFMAYLLQQRGSAPLAYP
ncbi:DUF305 domain-containing protein [Mycolicibacterium moriokaense]|nr:DUF305 domain-containing protein [Mycolicibacterium moriokaense]